MLCFFFFYLNFVSIVDIIRTDELFLVLRFQRYRFLSVTNEVSTSLLFVQRLFLYEFIK
jgi:hypothetical protein